MKENKNFPIDEKEDIDPPPSGVCIVRGHSTHRYIMNDESIPSGIIGVRRRSTHMYKISCGKKSVGSGHGKVHYAKRLRKRTNTKKTRIKVENKKILKTEENS